MFSAGVIRSHVIALVVDDAIVRFVFHTRSNIIESQAANLDDELQRRWFIILIHHLHSLSEQKLGLVPNMVPPPPLDFKLKRAKKIIKRTREGAEESEPLSKKSKADTKGRQKEQPESQLPPVLSKSPFSYNIQTPTSVPTSVEDPQTSQSPAHTSVEAAEATDPPPVFAFPSVKGSTYTIVTDGFERVLRVTDDIFRSNGLIGRGTCVMAVECDTEKSVDNAQRVITPEQSWKGKPLVLKLSFPPSTRTRESTLIDTARKYADEHGAHWALKHLPVVLASAGNLDWGDHGSGENTLQNKLKKLFGDAYEMRTFRATVL
ncbi:hypothetical protein D9757_011822 [Collybiopsis confluens]|uniref:Uncharacterized protein n=1 Tax=Collybiopsis confluens TaxID=2823264 RepID=A0A8H5LYU9_9AGAR|nr:hypothetical protein D9757_011822 [Collybiopsis confluens]